LDRGSDAQLALNFEVPAMAFHDMFDDRQPQAGTAAVAIAGTVRPVEPFGEMRDMLSADAGALILD
jgi:hypothetical protein